MKISRLLLICTLLYLVPTLGQDAAKTKLDTLISKVEKYRAYDRKEYPLGLHTEERYKAEADFARQALEELEQIPLDSLEETDRISHELLAFVLRDEMDRYTHGMHLNPIQADQGFHLSLNYRIRPLGNYESVRRYLKELNAIPAYARQYFELMRKGLARGRAQPLAIFEGYEDTYNTHIVSDYRESAFYSPFLELPSDLTQGQRDSVLTAARQAVEMAVIPTFKEIKTFFEEEYYPATRKEIGVSTTPGGSEFYQNRIDFYTTSKTYDADSIHKIGLAEVARIRGEMKAIIDTLGFEGSYQDFLAFLRTDPQFYPSSGEELLKEARDIAKRIDAELPRFFKTLPRRPYGVAPVPDAIAPKYTAGRYKPPSSDIEGGTYWVNTYKLESRTLYTLPALTAHEAVPGHHLQGALNRELADAFPAFRRGLYLSAFGEGWGLYSEYLAADMGIYTTPYEKFGQLTYEMWRACRLVVDTGIHALGWTRDEALKYMQENTALSLHEIRTETDRYIAWPGQALSYKMGEIELRKLRREAEIALGPDFDIREFHEVILGEGTVTLSILRRRVMDYIQNTTQP